MKHRKTILRLTGIIFVISMLLTSAVPLSADTVIDYVLYTDIRTYIDGVEISSYNINGYTAVVVEDLAFYGFDVIWNGSARTLTAKRAVGKAVTGSAVSSTSGGKVGDRAMPVYATDIKTYFDGVEFKSYNVGGKTIVYVDDLANKYSSAYDWNQSAKTLKVTLSDKAPEPPVNLMDTDVLYDGKALKKYNKSGTDSFKLGSHTYFEGFTIETTPWSNNTGYALFDLECRYSSLSFNVGYISGHKTDIILYIFLDGELSDQFEISCDKPSYSVTINLKNAASLKLLPVDKDAYTPHPYYGFANCLLYP